ncbi:MAG: hypothetical protein RBR69_04830 [Candidatus Cloacimonadaceae bacterium]|jgi:hypothetical protein|nr:hypothetical protein [Candidatus Cloacimonadota bacterium]MDY0127433.1 hypothetical protein [Candidatus Cloacimonadaceae bacterium]MCB5254574.1 hypothetical protein [Candidatus Cloacimonadota bacterium]MCK9178758.1 hypothetical protein [Candidatus Cloacimonadota bacterium]MCK9242476.1 hypothetical protein [Candidatus Cloacimonadota bacterium]
MMHGYWGWMNNWYGGLTWLLAAIGIVIIGLLLAILIVLLRKQKDK